MAKQSSWQVKWLTESSKIIQQKNPFCVQIKPRHSSYEQSLRQEKRIGFHSTCKTSKILKQDLNRDSNKSCTGFSLFHVVFFHSISPNYIIYSRSSACSGLRYQKILRSLLLHPSSFHPSNLQYSNNIIKRNYGVLMQTFVECSHSKICQLNCRHVEQHKYWVIWCKRNEIEKIC